MFSRRLAGVAAKLLGVYAVRLYHDQALYKEPGGGIIPWHADQYYWPLSSDRCVTIWLPLDGPPYKACSTANAQLGECNHRLARHKVLPGPRIVSEYGSVSCSRSMMAWMSARGVRRRRGM